MLLSCVSAADILPGVRLFFRLGMGSLFGVGTGAFFGVALWGAAEEGEERALAGVVVDGGVVAAAKEAVVKSAIGE